MGGFSKTTIDGQQVGYGDICLVEVHDGEWKWISCEFLEVSDDGDRWFRCLCEEDSVRASDTFPDYYQEVVDVRFVRKKDDPSFDIGQGI